MVFGNEHEKAKGYPRNFNGKELIQANRCKYMKDGKRCNKTIRGYNKSGLCGHHYRVNRFESKGDKMKTKEQIKIEIEKLQSELKVIEEREMIKDTIKIPELKIEVEIKLRTDMNKVSLIKIPKGWRLLELSELIFIYNNYQDKFNWGKDKFFDEIVKPPIKDCKHPYHNAWLRGLDVGSQSVLCGYLRLLDYGGAVRGVRFCRDVNSKVNK